MADKKISQLEKLKNIDGTEQIPVAKNGENYSITPNQIFNGEEYYTKEQTDGKFVQQETYANDKQETDGRITNVEQAQAQDLAKITELQGKLNGVDNVSEELAKKADKSEVTKSLQEKLDRTEFTERMQTVSEQLGTKADATSVEDILKLIPTQASATNQLADKDFVNSSIATNTAEFKGTFNSLQELKENAADADANDYGFVIATDTAGNTVYNRYKYVEGTGWMFEYKLNNSSFTALQWAAINSNITAELVAKLSALPNASDILTGKQAAAKYYPLTDGQDLEHLVETLNEGLGQVEEDMKGLVKKSGDTMTGSLYFKDDKKRIYSDEDRVYIRANEGALSIGRKAIIPFDGATWGTESNKTDAYFSKISVSDTTKVDNLNADMVDGYNADSFFKRFLSWTCPIKLGEDWNRLCSMKNNTNVLITVFITQSNQSIMNTYLVGKGYSQCNIIQLGSTGYATHSTIGVRVTIDSNRTIYFEVQNTYKAIADIGEIDVKVHAIQLENESVITPYVEQTETNDSDNVLKRITSSANSIVGDVTGNASTASKLVCTPTTTTNISKVPTTSQMCVVNTSTSGTFGLASTMTAGTELQVFINNTGGSEITITIPDTFKANGVLEITISAGNYGEINVISDGTNLYLRAV